METDEHAAVESAARIAGGNWLDEPAYRPWFSWQAAYGTPAEWDAVVPRNVAYQGPAYPYLLAAAGAAGAGQIAVVRLAQLLLATLASAALAAACAAILVRAGRGPRAAIAAGALAGVLHGSYAPLVFLDGFLYRDGPVAHVSALLLALPLLVGREPRVREGAALGLLAGAGALLKQTAPAARPPRRGRARDAHRRPVVPGTGRRGLRRRPPSRALASPPAQRPRRRPSLRLRHAAPRRDPVGERARCRRLGRPRRLS